MGGDSTEGRGTGPDPGLCAGCVHGSRQTGARGSVFWRCLKAETDSRFRRYPPLPVRACPGHERTSGARGGAC